MAGEKLLSEFACKGAKARKSIYYINDGAGLRLRVRPNGSFATKFRGYALDVCCSRRRCWYPECQGDRL